jgi:hypothetical protein
MSPVGLWVNRVVSPTAHGRNSPKADSRGSSPSLLDGSAARFAPGPILYHTLCPLFSIALLLLFKSGKVEIRRRRASLLLIGNQLLEPIVNIPQPVKCCIVGRNSAHRRLAPRVLL